MRVSASRCVVVLECKVPRKQSGSQSSSSPYTFLPLVCRCFAPALLRNQQPHSSLCRSRFRGGLGRCGGSSRAPFVAGNGLPCHGPAATERVAPCAAPRLVPSRSRRRLQHPALVARPEGAVDALSRNSKPCYRRAMRMPGLLCGLAVVPSVAVGNVEPNPSFEPTAPGKPVSAAQLKR